MGNRFSLKGGALLALAGLLLGAAQVSAGFPSNSNDPPDIQTPPEECQNPPGECPCNCPTPPGGGTQSAPEPATLVSGLIGAGLASFVGLRKRRKAADVTK